jgi:dolichol-phosphate mannosyltransferase
VVTPAPGIAAGEVPAYTVAEFAPKRHRYCVAVFVINEGQRLLAQLDRMKPFANAIDIVIADGGSTDGSVAPENLVPREVNTLLVKTGPGRLSAQMRMAMAFALERGYEGMVTIDGNNKDDPAALPAFIDALDRGVDHVQGSRFIEGGRAVNTPRTRLLGIRFLHAPLISAAAGVRYTDTTNGFRAYSRRFLLDPQVAPFRSVFSNYELHYYLAIQAGELGYTVEELPVTRAYPTKGPVPSKISPIRGNIIVLRTLFRAWRHAFDPDQAVAKGGGDA